MPKSAGTADVERAERAGSEARAIDRALEREGAGATGRSETRAVPRGAAERAGGRADGRSALRDAPDAGADERTEAREGVADAGGRADACLASVTR